MACGGSGTSPSAGPAEVGLGRDLGAPVGALVFVDPLNFDTPIGPRLSMLPAIGLYLAGCVQLGRVAPGRLSLLMLPGAFALLAAT